jgi:hypothetical protein
MHIYGLWLRVFDGTELVELGLRLGQCGVVGDGPGVCQRFAVARLRKLSSLAIHSRIVMGLRLRA